MRGEGVTEDEMVGWHHRLNGHESEQPPGDGGDGGGAWCAAVLGSQRARHTVAPEQQSYQRANRCDFMGNSGS